jgi:hypothetical protein
MTTHMPVIPKRCLIFQGVVLEAVGNDVEKAVPVLLSEH